MFGDVDYDPSCSFASVPLEEQLEALGRAVRAGKVRHVGLSNETAWGLMKCLYAGGCNEAEWIGRGCIAWQALGGGGGR